jgi:hypothetical protein
MRSIQHLPILFALAALVGCEHTPSGTTKLDHMNYVEVGTVTPHGVWGTKKALAQAGIPAYTDGSRYPDSYRILVPPEYRERAVVVLKQIEQNPLNLGYGITHE